MNKMQESKKIAKQIGMGREKHRHHSTYLKKHKKYLT
jgi:hypothetical protein